MKKTVRLNTGTEMPLLGFGTWKLNGEVAKEAISFALTTGYRLIDTADRYGNHGEVADALDASSVAREDIFLTTKLWMTEYRRDDVYKAGQRFLQELRTDYIDLLLIHWPDRTIPFAETLQAMNDLKERGMVKAIGVSNFTINHLKDALKTGIQISVNQVELHPSFSQQELKAFCDGQGIVLTAYSPMGKGAEFELPLIKELALKYGKSPAQIILNWIMMKNISVVTKSTKSENIVDSFKSQEWELAVEDIEKIDTLNTNNRNFNPPFADFQY
jgi:diketogulonate reductase-like aldo/keto reductase